MSTTTHHHQYHHTSHHHDEAAKAMTISYDSSSSSYSSYGLITPPSEMRSNIIELDSTNPPNTNILAPPANGRYFLRKQPQSQPPTYPTIINSNNTTNNNNNNNTYNYTSYLQPRRRSVSSNSTSASVSASASSATPSSLLRPVSPPLDIESRDFNVGEFTATVLDPLLSSVC